jgi:hypothetical protein
MYLHTSTQCTVMSCFVELIEVGADAVVWAFVADEAAGNPSYTTPVSVEDQTVADLSPLLIEPNQRIGKKYQTGQKSPKHILIHKTSESIELKNEYYWNDITSEIIPNALNCL